MLLAALAATGLALATSLVALGGVPHLSDEVVYTLQSRLFAAGLRVGPPADEPSMLAYPFWQTHPASYGVFPIGWPVLLALGELLGLPWLLNPVLGGLVVVLAYGVARELVPRETAQFASWILALSPGFWMLAGSRMAHTGVLLGLMLLVLVVVRGRDRVPMWALGGLGAAYGVLARPYDALIVAGPLLLWALFRAPSWGARLALLFPPALASSLLLVDNLLMTGDLLVFPVDRWFDAWVADANRAPGCNRLGFGEDHGCVPTLGSYGHTLRKGLAITWDGLLRLDRLLIGVPCGLLLALAGLLHRRSHRLLLLSLISLMPVLGYALYWSPGLAYGARFYHPAYLVLPLGLALALAAIARGWRWLFLCLPLLGAVPILRDLGDRWWCVDSALMKGLEALDIHEGVLFVDGRGRRETAWPAVGVDAFACDPMLEAGDAFLLMDPTRGAGGLQPRHDLRDPAQRSEFMSRYHPDARAWVVEHEIQQDQYRIWEIGVSEDAEP